MKNLPKSIRQEDIAGIIAEHFKDREMITCYLGSNAATPTSCMQALTAAVKNNAPRLPFMRMVHLLLQGPVPYLEEGLQDRIMTYSIFSGGEVRQAANKGLAFYLPCTLANLNVLIGKGQNFAPDVAILKVRRHPHTGEYSLGLSVEALHTAIDLARVVIAEVDPSMPYTLGQSLVDAQSIDYLIEADIQPVYEHPAPDFDRLSPAERRIGTLITEHFIRDGVTLQTGIGKIPDAVVSMIEDAAPKDLGVQTELYGDGLMRLQQAGIVTNRRKGTNLGYSTTSLVMGSRALYDYVDMRSGVQMRPCTYTNAMETIRLNRPFISVNTAIGVDLFGNVWADFIDPRRYYSGVGGQPDFIRAINEPAIGAPIIAMESVTKKGESKIVPMHPAGISLTASGYDGIVLVTEYGIADLRGLTFGAKALAIAWVAHPRFREEFLRRLHDDPLITKPHSYKPGKVPEGVRLYQGDIALDRPINGIDC